jgi:diguanylate cyclase (GGDEF)-like protein
MEQVGLAAIVAQDANELAVALERGTPKAVILGARVGGHTALGLAQLVRSHPRCNHLPILVTGRPDDPSALRNLGVDDVMRTDAQPLQAAQRVRDRILRVLSLPWERDPVSGLSNRLGVLDQLDAEISKASRSQEVLSVVLLELDGLRASIDSFGPRVLYAARQLLVRLFRAHLRRADLHGELDRGDLLVALPGCDRATALARVQIVAERFREEVRRDPELKTVQISLGAADTREGLNTVALRAERDLRASR